MKVVWPPTRDVIAKKSRLGIGPLPNQNYALRTTIAILIIAGSALHSRAQLPKSPVPPPKAQASLDPLGRETPRGTLIGFLKYERRGDYATAARYLQLPPGQDTNMVQFAKELRVLYPSFQGSINLLSDDPNGTVESALPPRSYVPGP